MSFEPSMPPPPPPPPLPQSVSKNGDSRMSNGIKIATIKPTTAGLLKFPAIEDNSMQQVSHYGDHYLPSNLMGSQRFKNELLQKQSRFSNSSTQSIDDRLKARREEDKHLHFNNVIKTTNDRQQIKNMPEKLMSTLSRDKLPFSYSVDVNDPNNKGKIDLSQIKSPMIKRRLLANMNSTSKSDEEDHGAEVDNGDEEEDEEEENIEQHRKPVQRKLESPTIVHYECIRRINQLHGQQTPTPTPSPITHYSDPPLFYNSVNNQTAQLQGPTYTSEVLNRTPDSSFHNGYIDELNLEVAKSLDSLSMLVADLPSPGTSTSSPRNNGRHHELRLQSPDQYLRSQSIRRSTFSPHDNYCSSSEFYGRGSKSPEKSLYAESNRSIGDYLLSPNSNYFTTSSTSPPYSTSPYYGNTLEPEVCNFNTCSPPKSTSRSTFSPINKGINSFSRQYNMN